MRRLEVFTGAGRRRAWTAEEKAQIVAESYESGEKVSAVARRHGLTPQQLFGWRRDARRRAVARRWADDGASQSGSAFAPVIVEAARPCGDAPLAMGSRWRRYTTPKAGLESVAEVVDTYQQATRRQR